MAVHLVPERMSDEQLWKRLQSNLRELDTDYRWARTGLRPTPTIVSESLAIVRELILRGTQLSLPLGA